MGRVRRFSFPCYCTAVPWESMRLRLGELLYLAATGRCRRLGIEFTSLDTSSVQYIHGALYRRVVTEGEGGDWMDGQFRVWFSADLPSQNRVKG